MKTTTAADPEVDAPPAPRPGRPPRWARWLRRVLWLAVIAALGWAGFYAASRGFSRRWRGALQQEFRRHGLDIQVRRITLDPFEGLVADNVVLRRLDKRHTRLLTIQRAALDLDFKRLFRQRRGALRSVELRGTRLDLPADPSEPARADRARAPAGREDLLPARPHPTGSGRGRVGRHPSVRQRRGAAPGTVGHAGRRE